MVLIEEVNEPEIKPVKVEEKKLPVEKPVENAKECFWKIILTIFYAEKLLQIYKNLQRKLLRNQKVDHNEKQNSFLSWIIKIPTKEKLSKKLMSKENSTMNLTMKNEQKIIQGEKTRIIKRGFFVFMKGGFMKMIFLLMN